jgi:hypothetical protein
MDGVLQNVENGGDVDVEVLSGDSDEDIGVESENVESADGAQDIDVETQNYASAGGAEDYESVDDSEYVASEQEIDDDDCDSLFSNQSEDSQQMDWTTILPTETFQEVNQNNVNSSNVDPTNAADFENDLNEDSDELNTPPGSDDEEAVEKFPNYKPSEGISFQTTLKFNNKKLIREAVKEYAMEKNYNIWIKKNDARRIVVRCEEGCPFYMRISKRVGNQFWQVVSLKDEHLCHRGPTNKQAKTEWLAKEFAHTLRHSPDMKPSGLIALAIDKWGVKLSHDQAYRAKRKAIQLIQGAGREQFSHLRTYADELINSNPNSTVIIQCVDSNRGPMFERMYVCLEACKSAFSYTCRPLIGLDACFLKGDYGGQLMAAVGKDGNNQIFPIAYAVVEAETKNSWQWFIKLLLEDLQSISQKPYAFISDQQKVVI